MSRRRPFVRIGCPFCPSSVGATVPSGPGIEPSDDSEADTDQLTGSQAYCDSCGHEVSLYFY